MARIDLPDGGWADIREQLTVRGRRLLQTYWADMTGAMIDRFPDLNAVKDIDPKDPNAIRAFGGFDGKVIAASFPYQDAAIVAYLEAWDRGELPTIDTVADLDPEVYDVLANAVAPLAQKAMLKGAGQFGADGHKDPDSPTGPSDVSNRRGRASKSISGRRTAG